VASDEEVLRQSLVQLRVYEGSARALQARLDIVNAAISEFSLATSTLEGVKTQSPDSDTLIPVGGGSFVRGKLADVSKIVMGVGAGVAIEKPIQDSISEIKSRVTELGRARTGLQEQLTQTLVRIEEERGKLGEMVRRQGGDTLAVV